MSQPPIILDYIFNVSKVYPLVNAHIFKICLLLKMFLLQAQTVCCTLGWLFLYFHHQKLWMAPEQPLHAVRFCVTLLLRHQCTDPLLLFIIKGCWTFCDITGTLSDHAVIPLGHQDNLVEPIPVCVHAVIGKERYKESTDTFVIFTSCQVQFI